MTEHDATTHYLDAIRACEEQQQRLSERPLVPPELNTAVRFMIATLESLARGLLAERRSTPR